MLVGVEVTIIVEPRVNFVRSNIVQVGGSGCGSGSLREILAGVESGEEETLSETNLPPLMKWVPTEN